MLIAFAMTNRSCFRDRQELSMEAVKGTEDTFAFSTDVPQAPRLNRVAAVYGPNGSGKSQLVNGLAFTRHFVINSSNAGQAGSAIPYDPFLFDAESRNSPTVFETAFVEEQTLYEYGFAVDSERVHHEWLFAWPPGGRMRRLLERRFDTSSDHEHWKFGPSVVGQKRTWQASTRPNALLVSTAAQLNAAAFRPVVDWFQRLKFLGSQALPPNFTADAVQGTPKMKEQVIRFLQEADIAASGIDVEEIKTPLDEVRELLPPRVFTQISMDASTLSTYRIQMLHEPADGHPGRLDLDAESDGTQRYFSLAFPWLDVLANDLVLVVDELDQSLHPLLVKALVERFNRDAGGSAQLLATLHDVTLLKETLDRGQVWLAEKDRGTESTNLTALSDYRPRKNEALMRGYLGGRYGGVPVVVPPETLG